MPTGSIVASPVMHGCCNYQVLPCAGTTGSGEHDDQQAQSVGQATEGCSELELRHPLLEPGTPLPGAEATQYPMYYGAMRSQSIAEMSLSYLVLIC